MWSYFDIRERQVEWMKKEMVRREYCEFLIFLEGVCKVNIL